MAGHNQWSKVKRLKGTLDQKQGQLFSKLANEIAVAARLGGGNANANPRLRSAILAARAQGVPNDNSCLFPNKRQLTVPREAIGKNKILEIALESVAEELNGDDTHCVITTPAHRLYATAESLKTAGVPTDSKSLTFSADITVSIREEHIATQVVRLIDTLEDRDDVQNVHSNFDAPEEMLAKISG